MFSWEFCENFKNTFFTEHLRTTASEKVSRYLKQMDDDDDEHDDDDDGVDDVSFMSSATILVFFVGIGYIMIYPLILETFFLSTRF